MSDRRRGLGRGLGALIPSGPPQPAQDRPRDVFFPRPDDQAESATTVLEDPTQSEKLQVSGGADDSARRPEDAAADGDAEASSTDAEASPTDAESSGGGTAAQAGDDGTGLRQVPGASFVEIAVDDIRPNPRQPREVFDEDELAELVHSITELGVLQPIVVRRSPSGGDRGTGRTLGDLSHQAPEAGPTYELVMGERRLRAAKAAGLDAIPAIVRDTDDDHMLRDALLENLHRAQLNPLEEAAAYQQLLEDFSCTHEELASRLGRSRPQVSNMIRLLKLPPMVQRRVASGVLSAGHARALLGLSDGAAMERLAQRIVAEGLSVRSVEEIVLVGSEDGEQRRRPARRQQPSAELQEVAHRLSERFETRVHVSQGRRKGRITVEFAGQEDLERILAVLTGD